MEKKEPSFQGYMTVGQVAKKMNVTVRTLQYYDREGLLSPSAESHGGRRLYSDQDVIKLHQILSLKHLGFSLDEIKNHLVSLNTPADVADALAGQADAIREKIETLTQSLKEIEALRAEVLQMQYVNFKKYADIIVNLQMKNDFYWLIKHFDDQTLDHIRTRFDRKSGMDFMERFTRLQDKAIQLQKDGVPPESEQGQEFAEKFWKMVLEFTDGDMAMLPKLMQIGHFDGLHNEWQSKQELANRYVEQALDVYFTRLGKNPFQEGIE